ncbi:ABC transporter ATP-binding protein [Pseudobacteroides cellulosolvens]|uniref:Heme-transporting ATPase n=1 Tax=Pseudobacteroides cellulosolvens ATCC 35603 = DSM 2933 TaxID=398512 RepID=A0A0L6JU33_9FIRM|nr:ATP-binding cassette domain-containing protein [Pseudobacteroides cellulosolvens]KNY28937.1 Heme-transporting ATPase [Pseudobacteroides cellulosolvens ATCC 35603 = DSM 2933]
MSEYVLEVRGLQKEFSKGVKVVDNISFNVSHGDTFGFLGPNGAGKTTIIRMILGLIKPNDGQVFINNASIQGDYFNAISKVGALVEGPAFYDYLTARKNLEIFGEYSGGVTNEKIRSLLKLVNLEDRADEKVSSYSLGMKQRLGIAQALLNDPKLLILDEPTNGLDPFGVKDMRELIKSLSQQGITILISSHILSEIEQICNKVLIINKGKEVVIGKTEDLIKKKNLYEIICDDIDKLRSIKAKYDYFNIIEEKSVRLRINDITPEELLKLLIYEDLKVKAYYPVTLNLEEYFFNVLEDK